MTRTAYGHQASTSFRWDRHGLFGQGKTEQDKQRFFALIAALGRLAQLVDIAHVVTLPVSDEARWIAGQNIRDSGGII